MVETHSQQGPIVGVSLHFWGLQSPDGERLAITMSGDRRARAVRAQGHACHAARGCGARLYDAEHGFEDRKR
ncbi:hypothetical protein [Rhizobium sullae]|uniref:hypothetical protein n=1 Tax=Rhizobium sullae TaxID=50338 RepID=UPI001405540C|nr:hypothetical protein [Rhizobium sullae]